MKIKTNLLFLLLIFLVSCAEKMNEEHVSKWVSNHAVEISTVEAGNGFEDLMPIGEMVGDARIVSLGEPTHGNKEVFQLKHRMVEYLVTEKGFNIFAFECPFGEAYDINRYIVDGIGDPEKALAGIYYWSWDTKEIVEMLKWMRAYNADPSHEQKLKFFGFDPQDPERAAKVMFKYLAKVDPELNNTVYPKLGILEVAFTNPEITGGRRQFIPAEYDSQSLVKIQQVIKSFDINKERYIQLSSGPEWNWARQHARQVEMYIEANTDDGRNYRKVRDHAQAENIKWILDQAGDESKMIVWAHNVHIANFEFHGDEMQGVHLRNWFGDQLKIFGFFFNQGGLKAMDIGKPSKGIYNFNLAAAPQETLEHMLNLAGLQIAALDLHKLPAGGPVYDWFNAERLTRHSGGGYNANEPENYFNPYILPKAFDALVFIDSTTAVESINNSDYETVYLLDKKLSTPLNTGFENSKPQEDPESWLAWSKFKRLGVKMTVSDDKPYQGKYSGMLQRPEGISYGEIASSMRQYIDAIPYRGKTIRFSVAARAEVNAPSYAFIRLAIDPDPLNSAHDGFPPLFDSLDTIRVTSNGWDIYELETTVPVSASIINYGIYLRDFGTAWIDDVQVEVVE